MTRIRRYKLFYSCLSIFVTIILLHVLVEEDLLIGYLNKGKPSTDRIVELQNFMTQTIFFAPHETIVDQFYKLRETWVTSNLGTYLFKKNMDKNDVMLHKLTEKDHVFHVLVWAHWKWLQKRHKFGKGGCSVSNCRFAGDIQFDNADAVIIHLQKGSIPYVPNRDPRQIWIFLTDESPQNTFSLAKNKPSLTMVDSVFNWSMTYRSDADIPVPYGRTVPLEYPRFDSITIDNLQDLVPFWEMKQNTVVAASLMTNCVHFRLRYLNELQKHIEIDAYGKCGNHNFSGSCPGHVSKDCKAMAKYLFYLSFENSLCRQYLSEKVYQHAYDKGAIPVIMGPPIEDCRKLLPPNSFLHVDEFKSPRSLALEMIAISRNASKILSYHLWRNNFNVIGEHGYFESQSSHLCRVCEALNYNDNLPKVYDLDELRLFLDPTILCLFGA